jgi:hypothetical protein
MKGTPKIAKPDKKPRKRSNTNNSDNKDTKTPTPWLEDYLNIRSFKKHPVTESFIEDLATDLVEWAMDDEQKRFKQPLKLTQFYYGKGIPKDTFYTWCEKFPVLKQAHTAAMEMIATRREIGAIIKEFDAGTVAFMQPHYDPDWKAQLDYRHAQKLATQQASAGDVKVIMQPFEVSDVPTIKKDEE